ncbi:MAG: hypothetical protein ACKVPY_11260 [Paracoccaceae bacterium]
MLYTTWKSETSRFAKPRSTELKAVDSAFERCGNSATGNQMQRQAIADALALWIKMQNRTGQWKASIRNSTKDVSGKGTVERLFDELAADGAVNTSLRPYMPAPPPGTPPAPATPAAPAAPTLVVLPAGRIVDARGPDGVWHNFTIQQHGNSCVCATVLIVKLALYPEAKGRLTEAMIRNAIAMKETGQMNTGTSLFDASITHAHDWEKQGTNPQMAVMALGLQPNPVRGTVLPKDETGFLEKMKASTPKNPCLVGWRWAKGGGHFTVCTGPAAGDPTKLVIIDPQVGFRTVGADAAGIKNYVPLTGISGQAADVVACSK